MFIGRI